MKFISFIEKHQADVIERILKNCGLWQDYRNRGPPKQPVDQDLILELQYFNCESRAGGETGRPKWRQSSEAEWQFPVDF